LEDLGHGKALETIIPPIALAPVIDTAGIWHQRVNGPLKVYGGHGHALNLCQRPSALSGGHVDVSAALGSGLDFEPPFQCKPDRANLIRPLRLLSKHHDRRDQFEANYQC
jgi:hypothetical protein